jgi:hypothetical protein
MRSSSCAGLIRRANPTSWRASECLVCSSSSRGLRPRQRRAVSWTGCGSRRTTRTCASAWLRSPNVRRGTRLRRSWTITGRSHMKEGRCSFPHRATCREGPHRRLWSPSSDRGADLVCLGPRRKQPRFARARFQTPASPRAVGAHDHEHQRLRLPHARSPEVERTSRVSGRCPCWRLCIACATWRRCFPFFLLRTADLSGSIH